MAGTVGIQQKLLIRFTITGDATGGDAYTLTRQGRVVDAAAIITAGAAGGRSLQFYKNVTGTTVTGTIAATSGSGAVARPQTITHANAQINAGNTLGILAAGGGASAVRAVAWVEFIPPLADVTTIT